MRSVRTPANPRRLAIRLGIPLVLVVIGVAVLFSRSGGSEPVGTGDGSVCAPGAPQWLQVVTSEPAMQPPAGATAITRNAVLSCYEFPFIGNLGPDIPEVSATMGFATQDSDEQILTGLQLAAGLNDWEESTAGPSAGCFVKIIDGVPSYLTITAGAEQNYEVAISRADPGICAGSQS